MQVDWDVVNGTKVRRTRQILEITRRCVVSQIPIDCSGGATDPSVLLKVQSVLPGTNSVFPDPAYPALLDDMEITAVMAVDTVEVSLIYRLNLTLGDPNTFWFWSKSRDTLSYTEETYSTALGANSILTYYKGGLGAGPADNSIPPSAYQRIGKARRLRGYKVLTVSGRMYYDVWATQVEPVIDPAEFCINEDTWGAYARGKWLYMGAKVDVPLLPTNEPAILIATVSLKFLYEPLGHYALMAYLNERHEHPSDAILEQDLRAFGLPAVGQVIRRNGKSLASIYTETTFSDKFKFTP